ncbi:MAG: hypothetical protein M1816_004298 [Peltula sp. TS41687]|nr:MAG: hypothetical protein M1816_004298 [Peltula sp. TS41687]
MHIPGRLMITLICPLIDVILVSGESWTPIVVKNVTLLGPQISTDLTNVSRDGGHSVLLNNQILWLYDDTECMSVEGKQLSFVSNTAACASDLAVNISNVMDFGVEVVGKDEAGHDVTAILSHQAIGGGGWIPFGDDESDFNDKDKGKKRIAIWPGTAPTPVNRTHAFLYAPVVHVNSDPEDPAGRYMPRGMTLVWISTSDDGPQAYRTSRLLFPDEQVPYGGYGAVVGSPSHDTARFRSKDDRDVYLLGVTDAGLQMARVDLKHIEIPSAYSYFNPIQADFTHEHPSPNNANKDEIYMPGTFTSGTLFFSPYLKTFVLVYFNRMVDSTFYIRFLDLNQPLKDARPRGSIGARDVEALVRYSWSEEQVLYRSPPGKGGFNYAGAAHPEYFNRQYYPRTTHFALRNKLPWAAHGNEWYGASEVSEPTSGGDGKHLLLSWTSQLRGGFDKGIYEIQLARIEFDDIPARLMPSTSTSTSSSSSSTPTATTTGGSMPTTPPKQSSLGPAVLGRPKDSVPLLMTTASFLGVDAARQSEFWLVTCHMAVLIGIVAAMAALF